MEDLLDLSGIRTKNLESWCTTTPSDSTTFFSQVAWKRLMWSKTDENRNTSYPSRLYDTSDCALLNCPFWLSEIAEQFFTLVRATLEYLTSILFQKDLFTVVHIEKCQDVEHLSQRTRAYIRGNWRHRVNSFGRLASMMVYMVAPPHPFLYWNRNKWTLESSLFRGPPLYRWKLDILPQWCS